MRQKSYCRNLLLTNLTGNATSAILDEPVSVLFADPRLYEVELAVLRDDINSLMHRAVEASNQALSEPTDPVVISGERNLLGVADLSDNMERLRRMFELFERKTSLVQLLDASSRAQGVQIFIGGESALVPHDQLSVVVAPYEVDGKVVGTLGVVGPTRMAYERVIPIVDITAKLVSSALSHG